MIGKLTVIGLSSEAKPYNRKYLRRLRTGCRLDFFNPSWRAKPQLFMKLLSNSGSDRVLEWLRASLSAQGRLDVASSELSLFAFGAAETNLADSTAARLLLPAKGSDLSLLGRPADRPSRNMLLSRGLAARCADWLVAKAVDVRWAAGPIPQGMLVARDASGSPTGAVIGTVAFSSAGFCLTPTNALTLLQRTDSPEEAATLSAWFDSQWATIPGGDAERAELVRQVRELAETRSPALVYSLILNRLLGRNGEGLDEDPFRGGKQIP